MKKILASTVVFFVAAAAFANTKVASCNSTDGTTRVEIFATNDGEKIAVVHVQADGSKPGLRFDEVRELPPQRVGGPMLYVSEGKLELAIHSDGRPTKDGFPAQLKIKELGLRDNGIRCQLK